MNDYYKVIINNLEFYLENSSNKEGIFRIVAIGYNDVLYINNYFIFSDSNLSSLKIHYNEVVKLRDFILAVVDKELEKQLKEYIEKHINTFDFYNNKKEDFYYHNINKIGKNLSDIISNDYSELIYNELPKGNIKVKYTDRANLISYNLISKEFTFENSSKSSLLDTFYTKSELNVILAYSQYIKGLAPEPYKTLAKISEFLNNKKSIKLVMKDNSLYSYKPRYGSVNLLELFEPISIENYLTFKFNRYLSSNLFNNKYSLKDLQCLQYSSQRKEIDTSVLLNQYKYSEQT